jgi:hypothetical protein
MADSSISAPKGAEKFATVPAVALRAAAESKKLGIIVCRAAEPSVEALSVRLANVMTIEGYDIRHTIGARQHCKEIPQTSGSRVDPPS